MKAVRLFAVVVGFVVGSGLVQAAAPLQLALVAPELQMIPDTEDISGLRLQVYGRNANVNGVDLGFIHETTGNFNGVALGLVDLVGGHMHGVQWTWLFSRTKGDIIGWPSGLVTYGGGNLKGLQTGLVSLTDLDAIGVQLGIYNRVGQHISGAQLGIVNRAHSVKGLQLGIVNLTAEMNGVQIGIWNQIDVKDTWKVIPIVNWKF